MLEAKKHSLSKRYFFKLVANYIGFVVSVFTQAIIPKGLGPKLYGDFNFLGNFFIQITNFLDMGSSTALFTKLSHRQKEPGLISFYLYFISFVVSIIACFLIFVTFSPVRARIWPGQGLFFVYLAAIYGIFNWITQIISNIIDAYGFTVYMEVIKVIQKFFGLFLIIILYFIGKLNLANFFYYRYILFLFIIVVPIYFTITKNYMVVKDVYRLSKDQIRTYVREFYRYSHPLFVSSLVALIVGILDRWLLQYFSGSVQQGFYSLSYQIGILCFVCSSTMTPLLIREFSIAFANKDYQRISVFFKKYIPLFYSITAFFSCFVIVQAGKIIYLFGGKEYRGAVTAVVIMAFYPIHQTYGQLSGSLFLATDQTRLYRNIGVIFMILGLPITYFLIAPKQNLGLGFGAVGLAIKMVIIQFLMVNVQLFFNSKYLKLSYLKFVWHQIIIVGWLLLTAFITCKSIDRLNWLSGNIVIALLFSGLLYSLCNMAIVYFFPEIINLSRQDMRLFFAKALDYKSG